ncbi:isocitrate lyase family-domain-containing protein [Boletus edulis BED1]|uniref:methylisocitrate lyase n=1 Tax=Boletus edulis BED1 TaxID=1328754 RepID=A0AAD4BFF3_BOLED|nr:isocitrate lyase family-domain-containing protein [Boletus edulis BED1]
MHIHLTAYSRFYWQSTASNTHEPGPDLADYLSNTASNGVGRLFMAQLFHDCKQREARLRMSELTATPYIDYLRRPLIADADTGHGSLTAVMKLALKCLIKTVTGGISSTAAMGKAIQGESMIRWGCRR